jgi:LytS/YehU family sensor histidine kinase
MAQAYVENTMNQEAYNIAFAGNFILRFLLIFAIALTMRLREASKKLEMERIRAELSSLKSQVNPHFLFNTLNGIYGQALGRSELTADSIARLSSLMRYVLTEASNEQVSLDHEIEYIRNYIHLQRIRLTEKTEIIFDIQGETHLHSVPPLVLINFIENAFKYGVSTEVSSSVEIRLVAEVNRVFFSVKNMKVRPELQQSANSGIGLENSKRRLELTYGARHKLDIKEDDENFIVNLTLD